MAEGTTRIRLCGALEVELAGTRVEGALRGTQGRLLLAYLVLHRDRAVRRDELEGALWEHARPSSADALAPPLSRLRAVLGAERLAGRAELRLELGPGARVDVEEAHGALAGARAALDRGDAGTALAEARRAAAIAADELLPGLDARWLEPHRTALADARIEALELAAAAGTRLGGTALPEAERAARAAVGLAPFRETARVVLLEVLRARGNVAEALRAFDEARRFLLDELGAPPGPALLAAHEELLRLEPVPPPTAAGATAQAPEPGGAGAASGPGAGPAPGGLVERHREVALLRSAVAGLRAGRGGVVVVEGSAGIGKTRLLELAGTEASAAGATVCAARGSELERTFPFGVVRQLLEPSLADPTQRERLLRGAAAPAAGIFDAPAAGTEAVGAVSFATLHGLLWLVLELASAAPLVLLVDDLHWADPPSQRAVAHLARRLQGTAVLLVATVRSTAPEAVEPAVVEVVQDPAVVVVRPRPLSEAGVAHVVGDRLGAAADPAFATACRRTTGGNPLLLGQLLAALAADGVAPEAGAADVVAQVGPRALSHAVQARIGRLGEAAVATARAVAVLGDGAELPAVAAVAELAEADAAAQVAALAGAEVLRDEPPLGFVHPLVRDAVLLRLAPGDRPLLHARAAAVLRDRGASEAAVAGQLLQAPGRGEAWAVATLRRAADEALARGAAESAVALLRRALAEPPDDATAAFVLSRLGLAEEVVGDPEAVVHLRRAADALADPTERICASYLLAQTLVFRGDAAAGAAIARRLQEHFEDPAHRRRLLAIELGAVHFGGGDPARLDELRPHRRRPVPPDEGSRMLAALAALRWAQTDGDAASCGALADEALGRDRLETSALIAMGAAHVLVLAEHPRAPEVLDGLLADARRSGSVTVRAGATLFGGLGRLLRGELEEAEAVLVASREAHRQMRSGPVPDGYAGAYLARTLLERGDAEGAERVLAETASTPPETEGGRLWAEARLALLVARGRHEDALRAAHELGRHPLGVTNPGATERGALEALALHALGRGDEAVAAARRELDGARRWGARGPVGRALRVAAAVGAGDRVALLREAVEVLERSPARLEHVKALMALGHAVTPGDEAVRALRAAHELAGLCGAEALTREAASALAAAGAPVGAAGAVLSARERRMLALRDEGLDERAIAQALYLTPHEVRLALARAAQPTTSPVTAA